MGKNRKRIGVYAGSFDPFTNGHLDIVRQAVKLFDTVIVLVAINPNKQTLFTLKERVEMIKEVVEAIRIKNVEVDFWEGATVDYGKEKGAKFLIRGLRTVSDFEAELMAAHINESITPPMKTLFLPASKRAGLVSSTGVRTAVFAKKIVRGAVPPEIERRLRQKLKF